MFVYVKIDSIQEHQCPKEKPDPTIQRKTDKIQKNQTGHPTGVIQDPEKDHSPNVHVKPGSESFNQRHPKIQVRRNHVHVSFENEVKFVPPDEPCSFLVRFSTNFLNSPGVLPGTVSLYTLVFICIRT
jgi:hypothetical protein